MVIFFLPWWAPMGTPLRVTRATNGYTTNVDGRLGEVRTTTVRRALASETPMLCYARQQVDYVCIEPRTTRSTYVRLCMLSMYGT